MLSCNTSTHTSPYTLIDYIQCSVTIKLVTNELLSVIVVSLPLSTDKQMYTKHYCLLACLLAYPVWHEEINLTSPLTPTSRTNKTDHVYRLHVRTCMRVVCVCVRVAKGQLFTHIIHVGLAKEIRNGSKEWRWLLRDKVREKEGEREERGEGEREGRREERKIEREEEREGREREIERERERANT